MKMSSNFAIKTIAKEQGLSYQQLGARIGFVRTTISQRLNDGGMTVNSFIEMLSAMDYDLVVVPRNKNGGETITIEKTVVKAKGVTEK